MSLLLNYRTDGAKKTGGPIFRFGRQRPSPSEITGNAVPVNPRVRTARNEKLSTTLTPAQIEPLRKN